MKQLPWKRIASIAVIILTISLFVIYFVQNPAIWHQIKQTPRSVFASVLVLYFASIVALAIVTVATLRLCKLKLGAQESLLLTMYTAIVNFFGPLQSGPAFRGVYLKQKYGLKLTNYAVATSVYYFFFGGISVLLLFSGVLKWWLIPIGLAGLGLALMLERSKRYGSRFAGLDLKACYMLVGATILQIAIISVIYFVEVRSISPDITYSQIIIYTGAANLALFVSITPGAIGFRESFLILSEQLHHIPASTIVAANTIDRAIYVVFLLLMAIYIFGSHARTKLGVKSSS